MLEELMQTSAEFFNVSRDTINPETDFFEKFGINSIQALNLLSKVEKKFGIEIPDYELQNVKTFKDLAKIIEDRR